MEERLQQVVEAVPLRAWKWSRAALVCDEIWISITVSLFKLLPLLKTSFKSALYFVHDCTSACRDNALFIS